MADGVPPVDIRVHHLLPGRHLRRDRRRRLPDRDRRRESRGGVAAVLELTDYAPLALREPVRSLVWARVGCAQSMRHRSVSYST